jgi:hypothetical protein
MLTTDEQERFVRLLDTNPVLADAVETLMGRKLASMKFGEKVTAVHEYLEAGHASAAVAAAARTMHDIKNLASDIRGDVSLADRVATMEVEADVLHEKLVRESDKAAALQRELMELKAESARAVNSGERITA